LIPHNESELLMPRAAKAVKLVKKQREPKVSVSEVNLRRTAARILKQGTIVSTEVDYLQRVLGSMATQERIDAEVAAVRLLPWSSIAQAE
jgi:hypothetical protein